MVKSKVSIVIPVYNTEKYLKKCLDSIINQTMKELEIICVNDGSKDNSLKILKQYAKKDDRIKIIDLKENVGGGKAKNIAIQSVESPYFIIVDSDDYCALDMCEKLYNEITRKDFDIAYSGFYNVDSETMQIKSFEGIYVCPSPWARIYKTSMVKDNGLKFYEGLGTHDTPFYIFTHIYSKKKSYKLMSQGFYFYLRDRSDSIQTNIVEKSEKKFGIFNCYDFIREFLPKKTFQKHKRFINSKYSSFFNYLISKKRNDLEIQEKAIFYSKKYSFPEFLQSKKKYKFLGISFIKIKFYLSYKQIYFLGIPILKVKL